MRLLPFAAAARSLYEKLGLSRLPLFLRMVYPTMSDDHMIGPGAHEQAAHSSSMEGDNETAMVYAVLALASAVNRLAAAQEVIANEAVS